MLNKINKVGSTACNEMFEKSQAARNSAAEAKIKQAGWPIGVWFAKSHKANLTELDGINNVNNIQKKELWLNHSHSLPKNIPTRTC